MNLLELVWRCATVPARTRALQRFIGQDAPFAVPETRCIELCGATFKYWVADPLSRSWYDPALHRSLPENAELARLISRGDRVLEIGAHQGFYTAWLSVLVGNSGRVVALEPVAFNAMVTHAQVALNGLHNCQVVTAAAADTRGQAEISYGPNSCIVPFGFPVDAVTGDELDAEYGPFTVLKVDVEGYEKQVLEGCHSILERAPKLAVEVHPERLSVYSANLTQLIELIGAERYEGTIVSREFRSSVVPFTAAAVPSVSVSNLFLQPRRR